MIFWSTDILTSGKKSQTIKLETYTFYVLKRIGRLNGEWWCICWKLFLLFNCRNSHISLCDSFVYRTVHSFYLTFAIHFYHTEPFSMNFSFGLGRRKRLSLSVLIIVRRNLCFQTERPSNFRNHNVGWCGKSRIQLNENPYIHIQSEDQRVRLDYKSDNLLVTK